jgi:hypothetical protein
MCFPRDKHFHAPPAPHPPHRRKMRQCLMARFSLAPRLAALFVFLASAAPAARALATCRIFNDTKYSFTIESGNTSNQAVNAHTHTTIAPGKVLGKSRDGKSVGGFCKDGEEVVIKEEKGVVFLQPK